MASLTDFTPPPKPPNLQIPDPASPSMEYIFSPLRQQWVWDFFFNSTHEEVSQLQYAISDNGITLCDFSVSTNETTDPYANSFRIGENHRFLYLPSFSTGTLSVGFGVNERIASSSTFACRERYTGRVVRDDANYNVLFIAEDYNINLVEVSFFSLRSPTQREHRFMIFHREKFRQAIATIRSEYNQTAVRDALMYHYHATEIRHCPNCGCDNCSCPLTIVPKRHPLDREAEIANLTSYTGHYDGVASLGLYAKGENVFLARYNATSGIRLNADFNTRQKLAVWALCSAAQRRPVNPMKLLMLEAADMNNRPVTATDTFLLASLAEEVVEDGLEQPPCALSNVSDMLSGGIPASGVGVGTALAQVSAVAGIGGFDVNSLFEDACELSPDADLNFVPVDEELDGASVDLHPVSTVSGNSLSGMTSDAVTDVEMSDTSATGISRSHTPVNVPQGVCVSGCQQHPQPSQQIPLQPVPLQPVSQQVPQTQPKAVMVALPQPNVTIARPLIPLAPAAQKEDDQGDVDTELDERQRKAELRKARNRESAQRSNLKRKMQIQKLKEEIEAASTRENYLRAKEKMLREENHSLRTAAFR